MTEVRKTLTAEQAETLWDELTEFERRYHFERLQFSKEFLESHWETMSWEERCLAGRQENMTFEFLEDKWERLVDTQLVSMFLFCIVPLEFTRRVWPKLNWICQTAALTQQKYPIEFVMEVWGDLPEKARDLYMKHGAQLTPNFIAEYWTTFTESQQNDLKFRKLIKGVTPDHCPVFLIDPNPEVRAAAIKRMAQSATEEE